jgi:hypothetical protein
VIILAKAKKAVAHKQNKYGTQTECGLRIEEVFSSNKTWRGVTCKRCLLSQGVEIRAKAAKKAAKKSGKK